MVDGRVIIPSTAVRREDRPAGFYVPKIMMKYIYIYNLVYFSWSVYFVPAYSRNGFPEELHYTLGIYALVPQAAVQGVITRCVCFRVRQRRRRRRLLRARWRVMWLRSHGQPLEEKVDVCWRGSSGRGGSGCRRSRAVRGEIRCSRRTPSLFRGLSVAAGPRDSTRGP